VYGCFPANKAHTLNQQDSTDYAAFDRFRSRVGSIVRPSGAPLLTPRTALEQQPCEFSNFMLLNCGFTWICCHFVTREFTV